MKKEMNKEELQCRREFFKKAAKAAIPVVGAIVLSNLPLQQVRGAVNSCDACSIGCNAECANTCYVNCVSGCKDECFNACKGGCYLSSK